MLRSVWFGPSSLNVKSFLPQRGYSSFLYSRQRALLVKQKLGSCKSTWPDRVTSCSKSRCLSFRCKSAPIVYAAIALFQVKKTQFDKFCVCSTHFGNFSSLVYRPEFSVWIHRKASTARVHPGNANFLDHQRWVTNSNLCLKKFSHTSRLPGPGSYGFSGVSSKFTNASQHFHARA